MVYIKLGANLYSKVKNLIEANQLVVCQQQFYLPYPEFKRVAIKHDMELHREIGRNDIITYNEMELMRERETQTPEQVKLIQELKNKSELRKLKLLSSRNTDDFYFQKKNEQGVVKQMTETISYSMAFIFSFFMAGLTGYYVGSYFLNWSFVHSMILALAFIFVTIVVETTLFIVRQMAKQTKRKAPQKPQKTTKRVKVGPSEKEKRQ